MVNYMLDDIISFRICGSEHRSARKVFTIFRCRPALGLFVVFALRRRAFANTLSVLRPNKTGSLLRKKCDIFLVFAPIIDCGGSDRTHVMRV